MEHTQNLRPGVTIIVPVYNGEKIIEQCLSSLMKLNYPEDRLSIFVVDNGSTDSTPDIVRSYPRATLLTQTAIQNAAASRNEAVRQANSDIIAFTDDDCVADPDWLQNGIAAMEREQADLVAGFIQMTYGDPPNMVEKYDTLTYFLQDEYVEEGFGATANLLVKRAVFEKIGDFNEHMICSEDAEFGIRAKDHGFKIVYAPNAVIYHPARDTLKKLYKKAIRLGTGHAQHFFLKSYKRLWIFKPTLIFPSKILMNHLYQKAEKQPFKFSKFDRFKLLLLETFNRFGLYLGYWRGFFLHRKIKRFFQEVDSQEPVVVVIAHYIWDGRTDGKFQPIQHITPELANHREVICVNMIAVNDFLRFPAWLKRYVYRFFRAPSNLNVLIYNILLWPRRSFDGFFSRWNHRIAARKTRQVLAELGRPVELLVVSDPRHKPFLDEIKAERSMYFCTDNFSSALGVKGDYVQKVETELIQKVDMVVAISRKLSQDKQQLNPNTFFVPNGVDQSLLRNLERRFNEKPAAMHDIPRPIIGYVGYLNERLDYELLMHVVRAHRDKSFVFIGGDATKTRTHKEQLEALRAEPNAHMLGRKNREELPDYLSHFDVGLIPYALTTFNEYSFPLKLFEYTAFCLPIVSTNIAPMLDFDDLLLIGADKEEFAAKIDEALNHKEITPAFARSFIKQNSWPARVREILSLLRQIEK